MNPIQTTRQTFYEIFVDGGRDTEGNLIFQSTGYLFTTYEKAETFAERCYSRPTIWKIEEAKMIE